MGSAMTENLECNVFWTNHKKILIVEDEALQRHLLREYLCEAGYEVVEAVDGQEAMEKLAICPEIRFVITDLKMPRMDGFELITAIRKKQLHYVYILVQTYCDDEDTLVRALSLGADDFLRKPVRPVELCLRVAGGFRVLKIEKFEELIFFLTKPAEQGNREPFGSHVPFHPGAGQGSCHQCSGTRAHPCRGGRNSQGQPDA